MTRRITLEDVARHAGVSKVTASYVLNGRATEARIREATVLRVSASAKELGYTFNAVARSLSRQRTDVIAVLFQNGSYFSAWSGFTSEVMRGVTEACYAEGFDLMLHTKASSSPEEEAAALSDGRTDGVLILRDDGDETLNRLVERRFPCVQFFTRSDKLDIPSVDCDNVRGGRIATSHLVNLGHRRIVMICGGPGSVSSKHRIQGYRETMAEHNYDIHPDWLISSGTREENVSRIMAMLKGPEAPTALFVWSDDYAVQLMRDLKQEGIDIPRQLSVVGYDSLANAESATPPLTSVRQPVRQMAFEAARLLFNVIHGVHDAPREVRFTPQLDLRESTVPPR